MNAFEKRLSKSALLSLLVQFIAAKIQSHTKDVDFLERDRRSWWEAARRKRRATWLVQSKLRPLSFTIHRQLVVTEQFCCCCLLQCDSCICPVQLSVYFYDDYMKHDVEKHLYKDRLVAFEKQQQI